ncbi:uncharacterized protein [Lepeophtheirus salmonis]
MDSSNITPGNEAIEEKIHAWLYDDKKTLDYKSLSHELKIHANVAKQSLYNILSKSPSSFKARYSLSGLDAQNVFCVRLVFDEELEATKASLNSLTSIAVHSLSLKDNYNFMLSLGGLATESSEAYSVRSSIRNKTVVCKHPSIQENVSNSKQDIKSEVSTLKKEIKVEPSTIKKEIKIEPSTIKKEIKESENEIKTKPKEHGSNNKKGIAGLWAKASEKRAVEKENRINEQKEEAQKVNQVVKKRVSKAQGSTSSLSKKRKRIQVISDSESGEEEENEEREDALRTQEAAPPPRKELESESEDEIPSTPTIQEPSTFTKKRKVRKLVKKQYVDDEGYMVTKEEYENKSEEEEKEEEGGRGNVIKSVITKPPPKSPKKMKETTAPKNKQASIMNFFKKK